MKLPKLKRVKISSKQELEVWFKRKSSQEENIMVVSHTNASHRKFVSREQIEEVVVEHGWKAGPRFTIGSDLLGHVINKLAT